MYDLESYIKKIKLPGLSIPGNIFLAPMAGYSDAAFRSICIDYGVFFCFTEMLCAEALARGSRKTLQLLERADNEYLLGVQIFASNALSAAQAVRAILSFKPSLLDLNCGCSVPKVLKTCCGAYLLQEPRKIKYIVHAMCQETSIPISIKLRSGWDPGSINFLETAGMALEGGVSLISLHPRTRSQGFTGNVNLSHIRALKRETHRPIIGSGDLFSPEDALNMIKKTGCDGVMFARGAIGNPFIFEQARRIFGGMRPAEPPSAKEKLNAALKQLSLAIKLKGERPACKEMRKHFCAYTKGIPGAARIRNQVIQAERLNDYKSLVSDFLDSGCSKCN